MKLLDEKGRLFGLINVIDALVVFLILSMVVAGIAFVTTPQQQPPEPETAVRFATLDLGNVPPHIASKIEPGDSMRPTQISKLAVTDLYVTGRGNNKQARLRVRLEGPLRGNVMEYNGVPPRLGRTLTIKTPTYQVSGRIVSVGSSDSSLPLKRIPVILESTVSTEVATRIEAGDNIVHGTRTVATIDEVLRF